MRHPLRSICLAVILVAQAVASAADPVFVNGLKFSGGLLDATGKPGANAGRLGFFSDIYYDPNRDEWWALSDRGPGGGLLSYATRLQRFTLQVNPLTGRISDFQVKQTIKFSDPKSLLFPFTDANREMNGLNPKLLHADAGILGRSFDPEGLAIDPRSGHFIVADEYGPALYEFDRKGRLLSIFEAPANLIPKVSGVVNFVAIRDDGLNAGRQDNRGYEGVAISPDGKKLFAVLQDPLVNEPSPNNGRNGRNVRIVVFDNDYDSPTYQKSIAQYVYQLEPQADVKQRILDAGGSATDTDPRQGRNIGVSAIIAINDHEFLVIERDNRGIGVDDPKGLNVVGSKRVYKIDITGATDVTNDALPGGSLPAPIVPVTKSQDDVFIDFSANTLLPNGKQTEKWEGLAIGPRLWNGGYMLLAGNDNDYSVTQSGSGEQFDVYVDFAGNVARCVIDDPTRCEVNPLPDDVVIDNPTPRPDGFQLLPGLLHSYRASKTDLAGYVKPKDFRFGHGGDHDCDDHWFGPGRRAFDFRQILFPFERLFW